MNSKTSLKFATISLTSFAFALLADQADATQHKQNFQGREVVVHSNPIPVILHRLVPPQHGRHVTQREVAKGTIPQPRSTSIRKR